MYINSPLLTVLIIVVINHLKIKNFLKDKPTLGNNVFAFCFIHNASRNVYVEMTSLTSSLHSCP